MVRTSISGSMMRLVCLLVMGLPLFMFTPQQAYAANIAGSFRGNAYGVDVSASLGPSTVGLRKLGVIACTCLGTDGKTAIVKINPVTSGKLLSLQGVESTVLTNRSASAANVRTSSKITGLSLLDGLITADAIEAVANANISTGQILVNETGSRFTNLRIANSVIAIDTPVNTRISLPGFGSVIFREVIKETPSMTLKNIQVNMLHIKITQQNELNLPVGAEIIIGHAAAGFSRSGLPAIVQGNASALNSKSVTGPLQTSLTNIAGLSTGCDGTSGRTVQSGVKDLKVPGLIQSGVAFTTVFGGIVDGAVVAKTTARIDKLNLLNSMIQLDGLTVVSQTMYKNGEYSISSEGTDFLNLRINNQPIDRAIAPNTRINLPGLGYVILKQVNGTTTEKKGDITARFLTIVVDKPNSMQLPVGAQIIIGQVSTQIIGY